MVDVSTGHEHTLGSFLDIVTADSAARWLQPSMLLLAVLFFYFHDWKAIHCLFFGALAPGLPLGLLFAHTPDHLE